MKTLDCRAHKCPHPVVETRKLMQAEAGLALRVLVGDPTARENVSRLAANYGYEIKAAETEGGFALELTPASRPQETAAGPAIQGKTVVFIGSDVMGAGSDELGRLLLRNYLFTLTELGEAPDVMLFVNAGVRLTTEGSEVIEALDKLACMGTDVASCGLCLDFFGLKEQLAVGRSTNMLEIAETLQKAGRTIRP